MGQVYGSIHPKLAMRLRDEFGLSTLVETGTFNGETVSWAVGKFDKIITMDINKSYTDKAKEKFPSVTVLHGDSRVLLPEVCKDVDNVLFWLDAHYAGLPETFDPLGIALKDEIKAINNFNGNHAVMIDDYQAVVSQNEKVYFNLLREGGREIAVFEDVVVACRKMPDNLIGYKHG